MAEGNLQPNLKVGMERTMGIEDARGRLGELADGVAEGEGPIVLSRRGVARAMLIDREEYLAFKLARTREARAELESLLGRIEAQVVHVGLDREIVQEAIALVRKLD